MILPGSEYLTRGLHAIAQSFLILDLTGLLVFLVFSLAELGSFTAELKYRRRYFSNPGLLLSKIRKSPGVQELPEPEKILATISLPEKEKALAEELLNLSLKPEEKKAVLQDFFNHIEQGFQKILEKTDLIAKVAPAFGLIGTLIPLGPGLAALGQGDIETLAQAVIIAFDTTVAGLISGSIAFCISKVRRRWYQGDLDRLDIFLETIK